MRRIVVDLADRRPLWRMPAAVAARLRERLPHGWELAEVQALADGRADGGAASAETLAAVADAEIYVGFGLPADVVRAAQRLRWAHSATAGVGSALTDAFLASDIVLTNSAGVHAPAMAETVLAMMLHFARGLDVAVRAQAAGRWDKSAFDGGDAPVGEIAGATLGILGYGGIGREAARRAASLGMRVLALRRGGSGERERWRPPAGAGPAVDEPEVELLTGDDGLPRLLRESDYLLLAAPLTEATRGTIGAAAIAAMKPGAVLVNVARGGLVDEEALVDALRAGRLRGAALDVFAIEPLPDGHPFWTLPNTLVTPHISAYTQRFWQREAALLEDNLRRYLAGEPLINVVDRSAGY